MLDSIFIQFNTCSDMLVCFLNYEPLPELMQGAGIAILTLLVSFAIGILIHHLGERNKEGGFLDIHIALDYVWRFKLSIVMIVLIVITPFFMGIDDIIFKIIIFLLWLLSFIALIKITFRLYDWIKGDKNEFRKKYFSHFSKTRRDKLISWSDFWSMNENKRFIEKDFFLLFSKEIDGLLKSNNAKDWDILQKLFDNFLSNIDKRNLDFLLVFPEFFPKVLEWHFVVFKKFNSKEDKSNIVDIDNYLFPIQYSIDTMIHFVTKEALIGESRNAQSYFKSLKEHFHIYENEYFEGHINNSIHYIEHIPVYEDCLDLIPKSQQFRDILSHYFPKSWKITLSNLKENKISNIWYGRYHNWSLGRLSDEDNKRDLEMERFSMELFPEVEPRTWAHIYTFVLRPWGESRIKDIIEKGITFGYSGRLVTGDINEIEEKFKNRYEAEKHATIDLTLYLFGNIFTRENIDGWLKELDNMSYLKDSKESERKDYWISLLNSLKENMNKYLIKETMRVKEIIKESRKDGFTLVLEDDSRYEVTFTYWVTANNKEILGDGSVILNLPNSKRVLLTKDQADSLDR